MIVPCSQEATIKKHPKVMQSRGKISGHGRPILVRDIPTEFALSGVHLLEESSRNPPPEYAMKLGEAYSGVEAEHVTRIKVVITKQQLRLLLDRQVSVGELVGRRSGKKTGRCGSRDGPSSPTWRPSLETIEEGVDHASDSALPRKRAV